MNYQRPDWLDCVDGMPCENCGKPAEIWSLGRADIDKRFWCSHACLNKSSTEKPPAKAREETENK